jgi:uncharacterized repeat protein (TIGR03843 family)
MISKDNTALTTLETGQITITGEFMWGSNYTIAVEVSQGEQILQGVYKPTQGERPLWDFPRASLAHREVAAYLVSDALGWEFVRIQLLLLQSNRPATITTGSLV